MGSGLSYREIDLGGLLSWDKIGLTGENDGKKAKNTLRRCIHIARGNNRAHVFETDKEKVKYLEILEDYKERYDFRLDAYVIMDGQ